MIRIPMNRAPTHPGEMLLEEFLNPMRLTQRELADAIHVPYQRVNELVKWPAWCDSQHCLASGKVFR